MTDILTDMAGSIEANNNNIWFFIRDWTKGIPDMEITQDEGLSTWFSGIAFPLFNGAANTRLSPEQADDAIAAFVARGKEAKAPLMWQIDSGTQPDDMGERVEAAGFGHREDVPGMAMHIADLPDIPVPANVRIEAVRDKDTLEIWGRLLSQGFGLPAFVGGRFADIMAGIGLGEDSVGQNFLGWLDDEPVATSTVYMSAGVAGIYNIVTLPQAQRRGIGAAITAQAIRTGQQRGYEIAILQSSPMGYPVYQSMGFVENCKFIRYFWRPY